MDKTIFAGGIALIGLGTGFLAAHQIIPDLHTAYLIGGYMWIGLGAITSTLGLKKQERLGRKDIKIVPIYPKIAIRIESMN